MKKCLSLMVVIVLLLGLVPAAMAQESGEVNAMLPVLDSLMLASMETQSAYAPRDPAYFWHALGLLSVNWGLDHPLASHDDERLTVPRKLMQEYATAAFLDYDDLLPLPADDFVVYDEGLDAYRVILGEPGDVASAVTGFVGNPDGSITVTAAMRAGEDASPVSWIRATMAPNPYADGIADPTYLYTVKSATTGMGESPNRIRTYFAEGTEESILETRYDSPFGYSLWYPPELFSVTSDNGFDDFSALSAKALAPLSMTMVSVDVTDEEATALLDEAVYEWRAGGAELAGPKEIVLDSGLTATTIAASADGVVTEYTLVKGGDLHIAVTAIYPVESTEGYGAHWRRIIESITVN